jgi:hypothetical protein
MGSFGMNACGRVKQPAWRLCLTGCYGGQRYEDFMRIFAPKAAADSMLALHATVLNNLGCLLGPSKGEPRRAAATLQQAVRRQMANAASEANATLARQLFAKVDTDGSGLADEGEIAALSSRLGKPLQAKQLAEAMAQMDGDGSGEVTPATALWLAHSHALVCTRVRIRARTFAPACTFAHFAHISHTIESYKMMGLSHLQVDVDEFVEWFGREKALDIVVTHLNLSGARDPPIDPYDVVSFGG